VGELPIDLDQWLRYYNYKRPHQGYRTLRRRSYDTVVQFLEQRTSSAPTHCPPVVTHEG
jgi:hypothetical protein